MDQYLGEGDGRVVEVELVTVEPVGEVVGDETVVVIKMEVVTVTMAVM